MTAAEPATEEGVLPSKAPSGAIRGPAPALSFPESFVYASWSQLALPSLHTHT